MAAKCGPDMIYIDGMEGGTGAGPHIASEETGVPGIAAVRQARKALDDVGKSGEISLIYAGGIRNGADVAKALALGADAVAIGHSALMALNCNRDIPEANFEKEIGVPAGYCYHCHTGRCPVGITTQDRLKRLNLMRRRCVSTIFCTPSRSNADDGASMQRTNVHSPTGRSCGADNGGFGVNGTAGRHAAYGRSADMTRY
jgi:glutamate synthase domain-containing protein 2